MAQDSSDLAHPTNIQSQATYKRVSEASGWWAFVMWVVVEELTHGFAENYSDFICLKLNSNDSIQNVNDCINLKVEILLSFKKKTLEVMVKMEMLS